MNRSISLASAVLLVSLLAVSNTQAAEPIYNVSNQPISNDGSARYTLDDVRRAIMAAGAFRGWSMTPASDSSLRGTLPAQKYSVEILIEYTPSSFSIHYVTSNNLDFGTNKNGVQVIHKNYNRWIRYLQLDTQKIAPYVSCSG